MLDPNQINRLEDYARDRLPTRDREELEGRMQYDKEFKQEAQTYLDIFDGLNGLELESFETQMANWEKKHQQQPTEATTKVFSLRRFFIKYRVAAILLFLLLPLGYITYQNTFGEVTSETLFASYFEPTNEIPVHLWPNRDGSSADFTGMTEEEIQAKLLEQEEDVYLRTTLTNGINAYNEHKYKEATKHLNSYLSLSRNKSKNDDEIKFFVGVSHLAQGNVEQAKLIFKELSKLPANYKEGLSLTSEWYMALTLLKEGSVAKAKKKLRKIVNTENHPFKAESEQMLEKMKIYNVE